MRTRFIALIRLVATAAFASAAEAGAGFSSRVRSASRQLRGGPAHGGGAYHARKPGGVMQAAARKPQKPARLAKAEPSMRPQRRR